jgi:hypothetical protein
MGRHGLMIPAPDGASSVSVREGDDRVRDGNGSTLAARRTDHKSDVSRTSTTSEEKDGRPISTDSLHALRRCYGPPIHPLFARGSGSHASVGRDSSSWGRFRA